VLQTAYSKRDKTALFAPVYGTRKKIEIREGSARSRMRGRRAAPRFVALKKKNRP